MSSAKDWRGTSEAAGDELFLCRAVAPLVFTDIRAVLCHSVFCTDPSKHGGLTKQGREEGLALLARENTVLRVLCSSRYVERTIEALT